ncbi:MAG TPA: HTH domain-containing protein [Usitatibacter sp.]|nr:HTH domain-containing protein [Usitatibacter sp.]
MRAGRLLNLLLLLQARGRASATWLAGETGVSVRTILRDIDELSTSGVPVRSVRGADGGFELIEGWRTRLTGLTPAEALASTPAGWQGDAHRAATRFHVDTVGWYRREERPTHLPAIADAVWKDQRLSIRYDSW